MIVTDKNIKIAAVELFSAALLDVFPQTILIQGADSSLGFVLHAQVFQPIDALAIKLIQERFCFLQRQPLTIEPIEIMRENAATLFRHRAQTSLAQRVMEDPQNIISLVRMGSYYGYNEIETALEVRETGEIEILDYKWDREESSLLIFHAAVCPDKKNKKQFCKIYKHYLKNNHRVLGERQQLFFESKTMPEKFIWLKKGIALKEQILEDWKQRLETARYERMAFPANTTRTLLHEIERLHPTYPLRVAEILEKDEANLTQEKEGLLTSTPHTSIHLYHLCHREDLLEEMISSLQFLNQSINMLGIEYRYYLAMPKAQTRDTQGFTEQGKETFLQALKVVGLDYTISQKEEGLIGPVLCAYHIDSLEREWEAAKIEIFSIIEPRAQKEKSLSGNFILWAIKLTALTSLERLIALKIENRQSGNREVENQND